MNESMGRKRYLYKSVPCVKHIIRQTPIKPLVRLRRVRWVLSDHLMDTDALFRTALFVMIIHRVYTIQPAKKLTNVYTT